MSFRSTFRQSRGVEMVLVIVVISVVAALGAIALQLVVQENTASSIRVDREQALHVAEAGIYYYRWHLAHDPEDYTDDTGEAGPYVHDYTDLDGNVVGQYSLDITPPPIGSTIATVQSTGYLLSDPTKTRTITARMGIPSFSNFAVIANDVMRFGSGTETFGPIHSNDGIRFDGIAAHGLVTSACTTYDDPDHSGPNEDCVHTHLPGGPDSVFLGGRQFPVSSVDFVGITADLAQMKQSAINNGTYFAPSSALGYHIVVRTDDTMDVYRVNTMARCQYRVIFWWFDYPDIWSVSSETYIGNYPLPANGVTFVEDDLWINGQIDGERLTFVAAREPLASEEATIIVNNDLTYTHHDGTDVIGLIAQTDISSGFYSEDDLVINAAVIAQNGRAGRYHYDPHGGSSNPSGCTANVYRDTLTLDGAIATNQRYGWAYTDGTGYQNRNLTFDENLTFGPPPSFPTTGEYSVISWDEDNR